LSDYDDYNSLSYAYIFYSGLTSLGDSWLAGDTVGVGRTTVSQILFSGGFFIFMSAGVSFSFEGFYSEETCLEFTRTTGFIFLALVDSLTFLDYHKFYEDYIVFLRARRDLLGSAKTGFDSEFFFFCFYLFTFL
jgi:hypothetical protein